MARPTKPAKDRYSEVVAVRLTPAESKALAKAAKDTGMKKSELLRRCLLVGLQLEIVASQRRET